jgi:hypothetical protein
MRTIFATLCFLVCAANASAQALPAGRARSWDVSLGYSYVIQSVGSSTQAGLNGFDGSITIGLSSRLAVKADAGYALSGNLLGTPSHSDLFSCMAGPVYYPTGQRGRASPYIEALLGGARVSGPVPVAGGILIGGYADGLAWAVGGGVNYRVSNSIGIRTGLDYIETGYFGPARTIQGQSNIRVTAAVVYVFGAPSFRRRRR